MGVPGCPELAACTASIESVRIVLMLVSSMPLTGTAGEAVAGAISTPFALTLAVSLLRTNQVSGGRFERYPATPRARLKSGRFVRPPPSCDFWAVNAVLECIALARDLLVAEPLLGVASNLLQRRGPVNHVHRQTKSVGLVFDRQLHRSIDVPLLLVAPHVQISVLATVRQPVNQPGIAVEVEDDWLVNREQRIEVPVRQPVRMFRVRFQLEQIHDMVLSDFANAVLNRGRYSLVHALWSGTFYEAWCPSIALTDLSVPFWRQLARPENR